MVNRLFCFYKDAQKKMSREHFLSFLNSNIGTTKNFKWKEAVWLAEWQIFVLPDEDTANNIIQTAEKMQAIRDIFSKPIIVTSWYRPKEYNKFIGSKANNSKHIQGLACDFIVKGYKSDSVREILLDYLERLDIRMENLPNASWVHIDLGKVVKNRFFVPY